MSKPWNYDPKVRLAELIGQLLNVPGPASIADVQLAGENADVVGAKEADDLNIAAGKEDLANHFESLLDSIDAIPDSDKRHRAYDALYRIVNGAVLIAKSGIDPLNEFKRGQDKHAAAMRAKQARTRAERDKVVLSVIDERERRGRPSSWAALKLPIKKVLVGKKLGKLGKISAPTFYRIKRRRKKIVSPFQG